MPGVFAAETGSFLIILFDVDYLGCGISSIFEMESNSLTFQVKFDAWFSLFTTGIDLYI